MPNADERTIEKIIRVFQETNLEGLEGEIEAGRLDDIEDVEDAYNEVRDAKARHTDLVEQKIIRGGQVFRLTILALAAFATAFAFLYQAEIITHISINVQTLYIGGLLFFVSLLFSILAFAAVTWTSHDLVSRYEITPEGELGERKWMEEKMRRDLQSLAENRALLVSKTHYLALAQSTLVAGLVTIPLGVFPETSGTIIVIVVLAAVYSILFDRIMVPRIMDRS